ncbi:MAG: hypothetical protein KGI78_00040 [Patescibacteria group bacterium]|nr:hypothetical protein [Patescibacteria group bacterium]MDE1944473.1 hypothetical protein [Patescibacteria group bacterium]MDE1944774.1 hypothetical protein [Patescibacteria group bacterium]MDE2057227.1 hypothetical protein [Patescibacteria group bacterium]
MPKVLVGMKPPMWLYRDGHKNDLPDDVLIDCAWERPVGQAIPRMAFFAKIGEMEGLLRALGETVVTADIRIHVQHGAGDVSGEINAWDPVSKVDAETILDRLNDLIAALARHEGGRVTFTCQIIRAYVPENAPAP